MQIKDFITIAISIVAVIISFVSLWVSLRQRSLEMQRAIRNQMSALMMEIIKLGSTNPEGMSAESESSRNHRTIALTRQAVYLIEQEPSLITEVEYITVASGLWRVGDHETADTYWQKGIEIANTTFMKIAAHRGYGNFLFAIGKISDGRRQYRDALDSIDHSTDRNKTIHIHTHLNWLDSEVQHGFISEAEAQYQHAKDIANSIGNKQIKQVALSNLEDSRKQHLQAYGLGQGSKLPPDSPAPPVDWPSRQS